MIVHYAPLVHFVLSRMGISRGISNHTYNANNHDGGGNSFCDSGDFYGDLSSQGLLGLIEAVDHFDPYAGAQFSTYAILRVRGQILDYLRSQDWLSRSARHRARAVQNAIGELWKILHRDATNEEIADYLHIPCTEVEQALSDASQIFLSLDSFVDLNEGEESSLYDVIPDERQPDPAQIFEHENLKEQVLTALKQMSEKERLILSLYYYEELTLKEIGAVLKISEARVCQLHARAIFTLKMLLNPDQAVSRSPKAAIFTAR